MSTSEITSHCDQMLPGKKSKCPPPNAQETRVRRAGTPSKLRPGYAGILLRFLALAFQGALQGLVQGCFGFFVFLLTDLALLVFDFQLEEFFF